jgi:hypothetical protein
MSKTYKAEFKSAIGTGIGPFSCLVTPSSMETKEEQALWHLNSSRAHDGLPPLAKLPKGFTFTIQED